MKLHIPLLLFTLILSTVPVQGAQIEDQNTLIIDGDVEAVREWQEWSNYQDSNGNIVHDQQVLYYFGKQILVFNNFMYRKYDDGWQHLATQNLNIVVRNVYQYVIAFTGFEYSHITIEDCQNVVLGIEFTNPENTNERIGWLYNTQITVNGFGNVTFFNYDWTQSQGTPISIQGGKNSTVEFLGNVFMIESETLTHEPGMLIRNVRSVTFSSRYTFIGGYTPALVLQNVQDLFINQNVTLNNRYYSYRVSSWTRGGVGMLVQHVSYVEQGTQSSVFKIENCHIGIAFEDNGKHEALNNSPYVSFYNCDQDYAYNYAPYTESTHYPALVQGIQALGSLFVAVAWLRLGLLYFSDEDSKKKLAKELFFKVLAGTLIVATIVFGYSAMMSLVSWVFGK